MGKGHRVIHPRDAARLHIEAVPGSFTRLLVGDLVGRLWLVSQLVGLRFEIFKDAIGVGTGKTSPALWRREPWRPYAVGASPSHQRRQAEGEKANAEMSSDWLAGLQTGKILRKTVPTFVRELTRDYPGTSPCSLDQRAWNVTKHSEE